MAIAAQALDIEEDGAITPGVFATMHGQLAWADCGHGAYKVEETLSFRSPFVKNGDALQVSSRHMDVGVPYPFQFMEWWFVAIKRQDGDMYFYYLG